MSKNFLYSEKVHNHGHVILESVMGNELDILNNARVSFNDESATIDEKGLGVLNFLMKNKHGSPWEAVIFRFDIKLPIFVMRELVRHRIASINEWSARYSKIEPEFYVPHRDDVRHQVGKPGAYTFERMEDDAEAYDVQDRIQSCQEFAYSDYETMLNDGVAKEVARVVLPVGIYTRIKWTINLRSLFNFLSLRNHEHAQKEIRDYAVIIEDMATKVLPHAMAMFVEHGRNCP